jgi:hypothetical protein
MAEGTTVGQPCADADVTIDVANPIFFIGSLPLKPRKFPLKQLSATPDRAKRIAMDEVAGRADGHDVAAACPNLIEQ